MKNIKVVTVMLLLTLTGCVRGYISEPSRAQSDKDVNIRQLEADPDLYRGKFVMIGGTVTAVENSQEGSQLKVYEQRLGRDEIPDITLPSAGLFYAKTHYLLDSAKFKRGALVVMAGRVIEAKSVLNHGIAEKYPVIDITEIHHIRANDKVNYYKTP